MYGFSSFPFLHLDQNPRTRVNIWKRNRMVWLLGLYLPTSWLVFTHWHSRFECAFAAKPAIWSRKMTSWTTSGYPWMQGGVLVGRNVPPANATWHPLPTNWKPKGINASPPMLSQFFQRQSDLCWPSSKLTHGIVRNKCGILMCNYLWMEIIKVTKIKHCR